MKKRNKVNVLCFLFAVMLILSGCSVKTMIHGKEKFIVNEHLEDVVLNINDNSYTMQEIAYYIANGEAGVEAQALVYNPDNPQEYWNKHTNGIFIKVQARQNTMDNYIRDEVLALAAKEQGIALSEEEISNCQKTAEQLYAQLSSYQKEQAGITKESLQNNIEHAYLGQLYIQSRLQNDGSSKYTEQDWQVNGVCYKGLLSEYKVKVVDSVWDNVEFGEVTIERAKKN